MIFFLFLDKLEIENSIIIIANILKMIKKRMFFNYFFQYVKMCNNCTYPRFH